MLLFEKFTPELCEGVTPTCSSLSSVGGGSGEGVRGMILGAKHEIITGLACDAVAEKRRKAVKPDLSYDIVSGSDIAPCIKIDKPLVLYRFW